MENKKKKPIKLFVILGIIGLLVGTVAWSFYMAPTQFELEKVTYTNTSIPQGFDGFKIAFISDFDLEDEEDLDYLESCINTINNDSCDMIIFGGDIFENAQIFSEERLISILKGINVTKGKLAVLGENEIKGNTDQCVQLLEKSGFEVMRNTAHYIYSNNDRIVFAGLENHGDVNSILSEDMTTSFILTAVHQPDYFKDIQNSVSALQLSGHSAGGYIQIPFIGGIVKIDGAKTYINGNTTINNHTLMISNGIGMSHDQKFRFNCNPNAIIITLKASTN